MKKIYVLNVIGSLSKGGAEYQCAILSNKLDRNHFNSKTICFYEGPAPLYEKFEDIIFIPRGNKWDLVSLYRNIFSVISSENPDILHVWLPEIISVPAAIIGKFLSIPVIASHRNSTKFTGDIVKYLRDRVRFIQYIFSTKIISNFYINEEPLLFRFLFRQKKGEVIFNGLKEINKIEVKKKKIVEEPVELLFVGRLAPEKNLPLLLQSLVIIKKRFPQLKLRIFGEGSESYKRELRGLINSLHIREQVEFFGYDKNWHRYASSSKCLLLPSKSEGTANVVIEALSIGLPVVISNIPMSRSLLNHEVNALIVLKEDPNEWAEKVFNLIDSRSLAEALRENGIIYSEQFSIDNMVSKYEESYRQILD